MASGSEEDLTCPVCQDIFKDPVLLECSHTFCKDCIQTWWRGKQTRPCPVCKAESGQNNPPRNLALKNLCEAFLLERDRSRSAGSESICTIHSEKLKLFCLDHQQPVCVVCRDSKTHTGHKFSPVNEAAQDHRNKLQKSLCPLQEKLKLMKQVQECSNQTADHIKIQASTTEKLIKEQFRKLYQFLEKEENARISALREEEEQKSQVMKVKIEALNKEIETLSNAIGATEKELKSEDVSFLQNYTTAMERVQQGSSLPDPTLVSGALIDVAKHLGNLSFEIWKKMREEVSCTLVVLDPNTAHPHCMFSKDLTCVTRGAHQKRPDNPERFDYHPFVLGSMGFTSGFLSWDVEVGDSTHWVVGVAPESVNRKGSRPIKAWAVQLHEGKYSLICPEKPHNIVKLQKLQKIRVNLDCDGGRLSFCDPETTTQIESLSLTVTEKMFPVFASNDIFLKISPIIIQC